MQKTRRLLQTIKMLSQPKVVRATELAQIFGISERTVYRDIKTLVGAGIPIRGEAGVGYQLRRLNSKSGIRRQTIESLDTAGLSLENTLSYICSPITDGSRRQAMQIPIAKPWFDEDEYKAVQKPLQTGWVVQGPEVEKFESSVCEFTKAAGAAACTSATTGLHLALNALCIGLGDEVIVPSFSFVASANSVLYNRARPVLVDIDLDTFNVTAESIYSAISSKTRAIMPVHLFGQAAPMDQIMEIAQQHNLAVIEDTACALGTTYQDQHVGTFGEFGVFSFHPRKVISTGEGGMLITRNTDYMDSIRSLRSHGISPKQKSSDGDTPGFLLGDFDRLGYNYRMTDMQGALGRVQMQKLPKILARKRELAHRYDTHLKSLDWLRTPKVKAGGDHSYQAYVCLFTPKEPNQSNWEELYKKRNALMNRLAEKGIATRQGTQAIHGLSLYSNEFGYQPMDLPNAWIAEKLSIALPLYPQMTDAEQDYVIDMLTEAGVAVS